MVVVDVFRQDPFDSRQRMYRALLYVHMYICTTCVSTCTWTLWPGDNVERGSVNPAVVRPGIITPGSAIGVPTRGEEQLPARTSSAVFSRKSSSQLPNVFVYIIVNIIYSTTLVFIRYFITK